MDADKLTRKPKTRSKNYGRAACLRFNFIFGRDRNSSRRVGFPVGVVYVGGPTIS